ncbi:S-adenosylmethionine:tRNA ribosyltransferase-isomerase [Lachnospiraceae bacterium NK3A20]|nr:S-adenosylmethionine:tRNA ribosyltransferase-isomerase [Lachnospiraceae bacterium NK3A20]
MAEEKQLYSNASMNILGREDAEDKIVDGVHADGVPVGQKTSDYYFDLPKDLIAQDPCEQRDNCRMLVIDRETGALEHKVFHDIIDYLEPGETLVLNNTKVIPARLLGTKTDTGANVEVLLLNRKSDDVWETLVKPGKKMRPGAKVTFGDGSLSGEVIDVIDDGDRLIRFHYDGIWEEVLDRLGEMPLPPYITHKLEDPAMYNTVYAKFDGSAAAPTAGLHFTKELLEKIQEKGINLAYVTLHVGLGTFRPVKVDDVKEHHMHTEWYNVPLATADLINETHRNGKRVICVGTTSCRTVESAADENGIVRAGADNTSIFIYPGYKYKVMDGLITNFHLPESTLIMLVSAFAGRENVLHAYNVAVQEKYRFFSFGDACFFE